MHFKNRLAHLQFYNLRYEPSDFATLTFDSFNTFRFVTIFGENEMEKSRRARQTKNQQK